MKVLRRTGERLVFGLGVREKALLEKLLTFYPIQPEARPPLSRETPGDRFAEAEALLHESLRDQKKELAGWLHERLTDGAALTRTGSGWRLTLPLGEVEFLLQVLNELRVGAWSRLGSPENLDDPKLEDSSANAPFHAIMTVAGQFQMVLLAGLQSDEDSEADGGTGGAGEAPPPAGGSH